MNRISTLLYAVAAVIAFHDVIVLYAIMNDDGKNAVKVIVRCISVCIALVLLATLSTK